MEYTTELLDRNEAAEGIMTLRFAKPEGYEFRAGQWCFLNLPDIGMQDERGLRRHLSMASSPLEQELLFATKMSESAFKRTLAKLEIGTEIRIEAPRGALALPSDPTVPVVLLAGGIGITPFRSLTRYAFGAGTGHRITLFYSNRTPEEATFLTELQDLDEAQRDFRLVATMTRMHLSSVPWSGLEGRLNPAMIREGCKEWREAAYFLAGPPPMVDAMAEVLQELEIASDRIRPEKFAGY